jgi:hypothetical protein
MITWLFNRGYVEDTSITALYLGRYDELTAEQVARQFFAALAHICINAYPKPSSCCVATKASNPDANYCSTCGLALNTRLALDPIDTLYEIWNTDLDTWASKYQEVFDEHGFDIDVSFEAPNGGTIVGLTHMIKDLDAYDLLSPDLEIPNYYLFPNKD